MEFVSANTLNIKIDKQDKIKDDNQANKKSMMKTYIFDESLKRTDELFKSLKA